MYETIKKTDPQLFQFVNAEMKRQMETIELIASENFVSPSVLETAGSVLTHKYAEGYPGKRYYGGCEQVDEAENLAIERAKTLFAAEYANVQPHSGSQANMAAYFSMLQPGDTILGMDLSHGGHLTHGSPVNFSGKLYNFVSYGVGEKTGTIDFDDVADKVRKHKPKLIVTGASAYPRIIDFAKFRELADEVNALLMADIAHIAGLVATNRHPSPFPHCNIATTTTHKTLRGPRGGMILIGKDWENPLGIIAPKSGRVKMMSEIVDGAVMPGIQGGPLMHIIAAKAVAFGESLRPAFSKYTEQVVKNANALAGELVNLGLKLVSGGTDNHLMLVDLSDRKYSGKKAEKTLEKAGITCNKNMVPFDKRSPMKTSGIRVGTPAMTTRGMKEDDMKTIANWISIVLDNIQDEGVIQKVRDDVLGFTQQFPLFAEK